MVITPSRTLVTDGVRYYRRLYVTDRTRNPVDVGDIFRVDVNVNISRRYLGTVTSVPIVVPVVFRRVSTPPTFSKLRERLRS